MAEKATKATRIPNPWAKARSKENPYAIYRVSGWEWRVLKAYQSPAKELNNPYARWNCFVTSPMLPAGEYEDVYVHEILEQGAVAQSLTAVSFKAEVIADASGEWVGNGLRFARREDAESYARDLASRWTAVREWRVVESKDPVTKQ